MSFISLSHKKNLLFYSWTFYFIDNPHERTRAGADSEQKNHLLFFISGFGFNLYPHERIRAGAGP
jgi:hypothetical protein